MPEAGATFGSGPGSRRGPEDEVLAAERAFAIRVAYDGIRAAFLAVLAADAIVLGAGPAPGRAHYEALPRDPAGRLLWEPVLAEASPDGTLAFTAGPYWLLNGTGGERGQGTYCSVWRQVPGSGVLELVLDFGLPGVPPPPEDPAGLGLVSGGRPAGGVGSRLEACLQAGCIPSLEGALCLGEVAGANGWRPEGSFRSCDGSLGVLWGARERVDGSPGAFALLLGVSDSESRVLVAVGA